LDRTTIIALSEFVKTTKVVGSRSKMLDRLLFLEVAVEGRGVGLLVQH